MVRGHLKDAPATRPRARSPRAAEHRFSVDCRLSYDVGETSDFIFMVHALDGMGQHVLEESLSITPHVDWRVYADPGVGHRFLRLQAPRGQLELRYRTLVEVTRPKHPGRGREMPVAELPDDVLKNLMPTRYCESDLLGPAAFKLFGASKPGRPRVQSISEWIHRNVDYRSGTSDSTTTACDVFLRREGVCRDFAHLGIAFCRALNIPARLAAGYAVFTSQPCDFHAVFEAYLDGHWQMFDPTHLSPPEELVRIAVGRDAKDVAFCTIFGRARGLTVEPSIERMAVDRA